MTKVINHQPLKAQITELFQTAKNQAYSSVNQILVQTYWQIGKLIVEFEQQGNIKAEYGKELLVNLSKDLKPLGKGFSRSNLAYMRQFYLLFPKSPDVSGKLTWSHYLDMIDDNETIGIILSAEKNDIKVEYALGGISNQLFVSKYKIYLPTKEELLKQIKP
jgi:hypothetical protein